MTARLEGAERRSAAQKMYLLAYHNSILFQLRVLDFEISDGSPGSGLLAEITRARDKRDRIYRELEQNRLRLEDLHNSDAINEVRSRSSANSAV